MIKHLLLFGIMLTKCFAGNTIKCTNILRQAIIFDNKMPSIYVLFFLIHYLLLYFLLNQHHFAL